MYTICKRIGYSLLLWIFFFNTFVFAQEVCGYTNNPLQFSVKQNLTLKDKNNETSSLTQYFTRQYLVLDLSQYTCPICVNFSLSHNTNTSFLQRVNETSSCTFLTVVGSWTLSSWLQKIWWITWFMWSRSRSLVWTYQDFVDIPTLYGWLSLTAAPRFLILNRQAEIISEKTSRKMKPDYYLVLPWHFKSEIIKRETKIRKKGTKLIFPLPKIQII